MICDMCKERPVSVFIKTVEGNINLCEHCAERYNAYITAQSLFDNLGELFDMAYDNDDYVSPSSYRFVRERVCPGCGMSESKLIDGYKFGCSRCYEVFPDKAQEFFNDVRGKKYCGKFAGSEPKTVKKPRRLSEMTIDDLPLLNKLLEDASNKRDFEKAKAIDNKIKQLKGGK